MNRLPRTIIRWNTYGERFVWGTGIKRIGAAARSGAARGDYRDGAGGGSSTNHGCNRCTRVDRVRNRRCAANADRSSPSEVRTGNDHRTRATGGRTETTNRRG